MKRNVEQELKNMVPNLREVKRIDDVINWITMVISLLAIALSIASIIILLTSY